MWERHTRTHGYWAKVLAVAQWCLHLSAPFSISWKDSVELRHLARSRVEPQAWRIHLVSWFWFPGPFGEGFSSDAAVPGPGALFGKMVEFAVIKRLGRGEGTTERCHRNYSSLELFPSPNSPAGLAGGCTLQSCSLPAASKISWHSSAGLLQPVLPRAAHPCFSVRGEKFLWRENPQEHGQSQARCWGRCWCQHSGVLCCLGGAVGAQLISLEPGKAAGMPGNRELCQPEVPPAPPARGPGEPSPWQEGASWGWEAQSSLCLPCRS